ncbi:hypothetical protein R3P38DRAFT_2812832 [Favolaschia claudopus]|uniref:BAH domain-containing protein n=1 Tax=Favolaschia claudopus TaxID=2862362 RepID=A0AAV9Z6D4_9AGAR
MYFFVDAVHGVKMSHVQWFIHALGEDSALKYEEGEFFGRCGLRAEQQALASVQQVHGGLFRSGEEFHIGDFAYILPALEANEQHCLLLAQILQVDWECHCLHVRYWERQGIADTSTRTDTVDIARLDGKFFVRAVPAGNGWSPG